MYNLILINCFSHLGSLEGGLLFPLKEKNNSSESISDLLSEKNLSSQHFAPNNVTRVEFIHVENNTSLQKSIITTPSTTTSLSTANVTSSTTPVIASTTEILSTDIVTPLTTHISLPTGASEVISMTDGTKYNGSLDVDQTNQSHAFESKETSIIKSRNNSHGLSQEGGDSELHEKPSEVIAEISSIIHGSSLPETHPKHIGTTAAAGIAAGLSLAIALTGYIIILMWRKFQQ